MIKKKAACSRSRCVLVVNAKYNAPSAMTALMLKYLTVLSGRPLAVNMKRMTPMPKTPAMKALIEGLPSNGDMSFLRKER
jgi:hypothetical protein